MNKSLRNLFALVLLAGSAFAPAMAQQVVGTLHIDEGTVMTSTGGEFATAQQDQPLHVGDRVMISEDGKATLTYNNGIVLHYESPGVYTVQVAPPATSVASSSTSTLGSVAIIVGAAALAATAVDSMGNVVPDHPVSR